MSKFVGESALQALLENLRDKFYINAGRKANTTKGYRSTAEGIDNTASGNYSHAEGYSTVASGLGSHTEGSSTQAIGDKSHAEGMETKAQGIAAHSEGDATRASGNYSHAEGSLSTSSGSYSHAEGVNTLASGTASHAEGYGFIDAWDSSQVPTEAWGTASHAEGMGTVAKGKSQHVFGEFNIIDETASTKTARGTYVEIVGNGTYQAQYGRLDNYTRSNARTLDWNGNEELAGKLTVGVGPENNMDVATKQYVDTEIDKLVGIEFDGPYNSLDELETQHPTGNKNKIYLVSNESSEDSIYDEYLWVGEGSEAHYELIGTTRVDLSNYATKDEATRVEINDQAQGLPIRGLSKLIINKLTREQYDESEISEDELYFIVDDSTIKGPYPSVDDLPQKGYDNYIYLVSVESSDATDIFDEYIWIESSEYTGYEHLGSSRVDLSNYATKDEATKVKIRDWRVL